MDPTDNMEDGGHRFHWEIAIDLHVFKRAFFRDILPLSSRLHNRHRIRWRGHSASIVKRRACQEEIPLLLLLTHLR